MGELEEKAQNSQSQSKEVAVKGDIYTVEVIGSGTKTLQELLKELLLRCGCGKAD